MHATHGARAPGKLFLFGEYAVLAGGYAVVASSARGVSVSFDASRTTGYQVIGADMGATSTALPEAALRAIAQPESHVRGLTADVSELYEQGAKLGLGSSAASTIASLLAVNPSLIHDREHLFTAAFNAHREIQSGRGSGADVALAAFGRCIGYQLKQPQSPFSYLTTSAPMWEGDYIQTEHAVVYPQPALPRELRIEAVWLGKPASSTELIQRVEAACHDARLDALNAIFQTISGCASTFITGSGSQDVDAVCKLVREANQAMEELTSLTGAPVCTPLHRELVDVATQYGVACKPSGAGGGDFSLLMGHKDADWPALFEGLPLGAQYIPIALGESEPEVF